MLFDPYFWVCMNCLLRAVGGYGFVAVFWVVYVGFVLCGLADNDDLDQYFGGGFVGDYIGSFSDIFSY